MPRGVSCMNRPSPVCGSDSFDQDFTNSKAVKYIHYEIEKQNWLCLVAGTSQSQLKLSFTSVERPSWHETARVLLDYLIIPLEKNFFFQSKRKWMCSSPKDTPGAVYFYTRNSEDFYVFKMTLTSRTYNIFGFELITSTSWLKVSYLGVTTIKKKIFKIRHPSTKSLVLFSSLVRISP